MTVVGEMWYKENKKRNTHVYTTRNTTLEEIIVTPIRVKDIIARIDKMSRDTPKYYLNIQRIAAYDRVIDYLKTLPNSTVSVEGHANLDLAQAETQGHGPVAPDTVGQFIDLKTLEWWRELVDLNPSDLAPRLDDRIARCHSSSTRDNSTASKSPPTPSAVEFPPSTVKFPPFNIRKRDDRS